MYNSLRWLFKPGNSYKGKAEGTAYSLRLAWANFRGLELIVDQDDEGNPIYHEHENFYKCRQEATFEQASDWIAVGQHNYLTFLIAALAVSQEFSMLATLPWAFGLLTAQAFVRVFFNQYELWNSRNKNLNKIVKTTVNTLILTAGIIGILFIAAINVAATATIVSILPAVIFAFSAIRFVQNTIYAIHNGIMWRYYAWKASIQKLKPHITTNPDTIQYEAAKEKGMYSFLMKGYLSFNKFIKKLNPFADKKEEIEQEDMVKNTLYLHLENEKLAYHVFTPSKKIQSYDFPEIEELAKNIPDTFSNLTQEKEQIIIEKLQLLQEYERIEAQRNAGNNFAPALKAIKAKIDKEGSSALSFQETAIYYTALQRKNNRSEEEDSFFQAHREKIALLDSDYQAVFNNIHLKTLTLNSQPFSAIESAFIARIVQNRVTYGIESTPQEAALISLIIQEKMKRKEEPSHDEMQFILREAVNRGHVFDAAFEAERFRTQCIKRVLQAAGNGGGAIFSGLILFAAPVSQSVLFIGGITAGCVNTVVQFYSATREFQRFRPIYLLRWLIGDVNKRINELNNESLGTKIKRYETSYQQSSTVSAEANTSETAEEGDALLVSAQTSPKSSWWPFKKSNKQVTPKTFWHHSNLEQEIQAIHNLSDNRASLADKQVTAILLLVKIINETIQTLDPQDSTHHYKIEFLKALKNVLLGRPGKLIGDDGIEYTITNFHNYKKNAITGKYEYDVSGNIDNFERFFDKNRQTAKKIFQARMFKKSNVAGIYWGVTEYTQSFLDNPKYSTNDDTPEATKLINMVDENTVSNKINDLIQRAKKGELDQPVCTHSDVQRTLSRESESSASLPLTISSPSSEHPAIPSQKRPLKWGVLDIHALNELREDVSEEARKEYYLKKYGRTTELKWGSQNFNSAGCFLSEVRPHFISAAKAPSTLNPLAEGYDLFDDLEGPPPEITETLESSESPRKPPRRNSSRFSGQTDNTGSTSSLGIGREGVTPSPGREWLHSRSSSSPGKRKTLRSNSVEEVTSLPSFPSMNGLTAGTSK